MTDPITTITSQSWFSRLGSAFGGILVGLALIVAGIGLLAWNEGRSVQAIRANNEGAASVISVQPAPDPAHEGRLVHFTGPAVALAALRDEALGVSMEAIALRREVEFHHWVEDSRSETRNKLGGGQETVTTYSYETRWTSTPQDSSRSTTRSSTRPWVGDRSPP